MTASSPCSPIQTVFHRYGLGTHEYVPLSIKEKRDNINYENVMEWVRADWFGGQLGFNSTLFNLFSQDVRRDPEVRIWEHGICSQIMHALAFRMYKGPLGW